MRKGVLGSIAALAAGAGLASGQPTPPPPAAIGPATSVLPASGFGPAEGVPPPGVMGGPPGMGMGMDPGGMMPGGPMGGMPTYPPPGPYGATMFDTGTGPGSRAMAPRVWVNVEYLLWWADDQPTRVSAITTSAPSDGGLLGRPTTQFLDCPPETSYGVLNGFRVSAGWFRGADGRAGFELSGFMTERKVETFYAQSDTNGVPVIARPFIDAATGLPGRQLISSPGLAGGSVFNSTSARSYGAEGNGVLSLYRSCPGTGWLASLDFLAGFRYFELEEDLVLSSTTTLLPGVTGNFVGLDVLDPGTIGITDSVRAFNRFYGGQVGLRSFGHWGKCLVSVTGKLALGNMNQRIHIDGRTTLTDPTRGINSTAVGGLFTNATNICRVTNDEFAVLPELSASLGYNWCSWLTTTVGYNVIYIDQVARPGSQISSTINPNLAPASASFGAGGAAVAPNNLFTQDDFYLQGVTFGIVMRY